MNTLTNIRLFFWKGHKLIGPNKEIRITRTYEYCGKGVMDVIWCLRDYRNLPKTVRHSPRVITERTSPTYVLHLIKRIESKDLPEAIEAFLKKLNQDSQKN